jgi:hypothetical protein
MPDEIEIKPVRVIQKIGRNAERPRNQLILWMYDLVSVSTILS